MVAYSLLQSAATPIEKRNSSIQQIVNDKNILLRKHAKVLQYFSKAYQVCWPSENEEQGLYQRITSLYSDVFQLTNDYQLKLQVTGDRSTDSSILMKLVMYRNTCLHLFAKPSFILLVCHTDSQVRLLFTHF